MTTDDATAGTPPSPRAPGPVLGAPPPPLTPGEPGGMTEMVASFGQLEVGDAPPALPYRAAWPRRAGRGDER